MTFTATLARRRECRAALPPAPCSRAQARVNNTLELTAPLLQYADTALRAAPHTFARGAAQRGIGWRRYETELCDSLGTCPGSHVLWTAPEPIRRLDSLFKNTSDGSYLYGMLVYGSEFQLEHDDQVGPKLNGQPILAGKTDGMVYVVTQDRQLVPTDITVQEFASHDLRLAVLSTDVWKNRIMPILQENEVKGPSNQ